MKLTYNKIIIEGIDRLGKSTLIENIQQSFGYFNVIHYGKPKILDFYTHFIKLYNEREHDCIKITPEQMYQSYSFDALMKLLRSDARILFDRAHLGEAVYADMYRGYSGQYVFDLEKKYELNKSSNIKLILLVEDFSISEHFNDDKNSLGSIDNRKDEQDKFISAFNKSIITNKKMITVTDKTGAFRSASDILIEAFEE